MKQVPKTLTEIFPFTAGAVNAQVLWLQLRQVTHVLSKMSAVTPNFLIAT